MDNKLEDLKRLTFAELKEILESVEKAIKAERIFLDEVKNAYIQDGELWVIYNLQLTKVKDLVDKKNKRPMFNENQLIRVKKGIDDLIIWNRRRNNIIEEIKRREWGSEYFDRRAVHTSENNTEVTKEVIELVETKDETDNERFRKMFDELVEHHFKTDILIWQLETAGQDKDDDYIEYCVKRFKRRTITEWMKYYERLDKADQYERLKKENLTPELEYTNTMRITNAKFEDSTLGQWTKENLESFERKFVMENRSDGIEKKTELKVGQEEEWDFGTEIDKILNSLTTADTVEDKIYKDIEYWKKFGGIRDRGPNDIWIGESWQIAVGTLRSFISNDLRQATITGYYKGKKINFEAAERLNKFLQEVIEAIESRNEKNEIVEMDEENLEVDGDYLLKKDTKKNLGDKQADINTENSRDEDLRPFGRGELQNALDPIVKEFNLMIGDTVSSKKVRLIAKKLIEQRWNANEPSVAEALRKMGFVKGRRK